MQPRRLVKLTYSWYSVKDVLCGGQSAYADRNRPLWLAIIMNFTLSESTWQAVLNSTAISQNLSIAKDAKIIRRLVGDFYSSDVGNDMIRFVQAVNDMDSIAMPVIRYLDAMSTCRRVVR